MCHGFEFLFISVHCFLFDGIELVILITVFDTSCYGLESLVCISCFVLWSPLIFPALPSLTCALFNLLVSMRPPLPSVCLLPSVLLCQPLCFLVCFLDLFSCLNCLEPLPSSEVSVSLHFINIVAINLLYLIIYTWVKNTTQPTKNNNNNNKKRIQKGSRQTTEWKDWHPVFCPLHSTSI